MLETSHPPTYYLPRAAFAEGVLRDARGESWCEWKGRARYFDLVTAARIAEKGGLELPRPDARIRADRRCRRGDGRPGGSLHRQR